MNVAMLAVNVNRLAINKLFAPYIVRREPRCYTQSHSQVMELKLSWQIGTVKRNKKNLEVKQR